MVEKRRDVGVVYTLLHVLEEDNAVEESRKIPSCMGLKLHVDMGKLHAVLKISHA